MFHHVKELQFNARVTAPDPRFASILLEQFGGANGELKAAMQYFVQAYSCRRPYPDKYDMLMDIATEELSHLEIVGATITMLLDGVNGELKDAAESEDIMSMTKGNAPKEEVIHEALRFNPQFSVLSGGGPLLTDSQGVPFQGSFVNANGDLTVDLRSNIAAESRAKILYEYLMKFTDDPYVKETLGFLMTREIAHFKMFQAALDTIEPNFPPGILQGDPRFINAYFNMSNGVEIRGPWNSGETTVGGESWKYIADPIEHVRQTKGELDMGIADTNMTKDLIEEKNLELSRQRSEEVNSMSPKGPMQWSEYPQTEITAPMNVDPS
ncbi:MAG: Mn-containing catalase [Micavibrio sp.]|nr:Mn-containing catalase [Micavibrio sp.]